MRKGKIKYRNRRSARNADRGKVPQAHAARNQDEHTGAADDQHGRGMRLQIQQHAVCHKQEAVWPDQSLERAHALGILCNPVRKANDDRDFRQLGRLKAEQPAPRIVLHRADTRDRDQDQQDNGNYHDHGAEPRIKMVVDFGNDNHCNHACCSKCALPDDEVGRVALIKQRIGITCGKKRDQTDNEQQHNREKHTNIPGMRPHPGMLLYTGIRCRAWDLLPWYDHIRRTRNRLCCRAARRHRTTRGTRLSVGGSHSGHLQVEFKHYSAGGSAAK